MYGGAWWASWDPPPLPQKQEKQQKPQNPPPQAPPPQIFDGNGAWGGGPVITVTYSIQGTAQKTVKQAFNKGW
jgi:hypothetical protein